MTARVYDIAKARADRDARRAADPFGLLGFWTGAVAMTLELQAATLSLYLQPWVLR